MIVFATVFFQEIIYPLLLLIVEGGRVGEGCVYHLSLM